jgi:hypothetical protein
MALCYMRNAKRSELATHLHPCQFTVHGICDGENSTAVSPSNSHDISYFISLIIPRPAQEANWGPGTKGLVPLDPKAHRSGFLTGLFFDPEDGSDIFIRNGSWPSMDYTALYPTIELFITTAVRTSNDIQNTTGSLIPWYLNFEVEKMSLNIRLLTSTREVTGLCGRRKSLLISCVITESLRLLLSSGIPEELDQLRPQGKSWGGTYSVGSR